MKQRSSSRKRVYSLQCAEKVGWGVGGVDVAINWLWGRTRGRMTPRRAQSPTDIRLWRLGQLSVLPVGHTCGRVCLCGFESEPLRQITKCWLDNSSKGYFCFLFPFAHEKAFSSFLLKYTQRTQYTWSVNTLKGKLGILKEFNLTTDALVNS